MKKILTILLFLSLATPVIAAPTIEVVPNVGNSAQVSYSWNIYRDNVIYALRKGLPAYGKTNSVTFFSKQIYPINPSYILFDTNFIDLWHGSYNPPANLRNEYGNKLYFAAKFIAGAGEKVKLRDISMRIESTDSAPKFWNSNQSFGAYNYNASLVGANKGNDGVIGTDDDTFVTSGSGATEVDAVYITGTSPSFTPANISTAISEAPFTISVGYTMNGVTATSTIGISTLIPTLDMLSAPIIQLAMPF